jgi:hypothetical protein
MTDAHKTTTLYRPLKALEIDPSWYQSYWYDSYWYDQPEPERRKPSFRSAHILVWALLLVVGTCLAL